MRLNELFAVPKGKKVTEKVFARVLVASVCSIVLSMACLAGTTWAWFTVSIENKENVIQIGTPEVTLTVDGKAFESGSELPAGSYRLHIKHANEMDAFQQKSTLYVTLNMGKTTPVTFKMGESTAVYTVLSHTPYETEITLVSENPFRLSWIVTWFEPENAERLDGNTIILGAEESAESTEPSESATEPSTDPSESATEPSTEPSGSATEPPTEPSESATEPSTNPSESATEPPTEPSESATEAPTEPSQNATEPSMNPSEAAV